MGLSSSIFYLQELGSTPERRRVVPVQNRRYSAVSLLPEGPVRQGPVALARARYLSVWRDSVGSKSTWMRSPSGSRQ